jgi:hypothetical protein
MKEGDALALGAPRGVSSMSSIPSSRQRARVPSRSSTGKADVMDSRPPLCDELAYRGSVVGGFEQLDQRAGGVESANSRPVRVGELDFGKSEDLFEQRSRVAQRAHGNSDMGDLRAARA